MFIGYVYAIVQGLNAGESTHGLRICVRLFRIAYINIFIYRTGHGVM